MRGIRSYQGLKAHFFSRVLDMLESRGLEKNSVSFNS